MNAKYFRDWRRQNPWKAREIQKRYEAAHPERRQKRWPNKHAPSRTAAAQKVYRERRRLAVALYKFASICASNREGV